MASIVFCSIHIAAIACPGLLLKKKIRKILKWFLRGQKISTYLWVPGNLDGLVNLLTTGTLSASYWIKKVKKCVLKLFQSCGHTVAFPGHGGPAVPNFFFNASISMLKSSPNTSRNFKNSRNVIQAQDLKLSYNFLFLIRRFHFSKKINPYRKLHQKVGRAERTPK